jgi:hypothetical protein
LAQPDWSKAQRREVIIREAISGEGSMTSRVETAARALGLTARTVRRLIARYKTSAQTTSLLAHQRGPHKRHRSILFGTPS